MDTICPSCKCKNTIEGELVRGPGTFFKPDGLKFFTFSTMVDLLERFHACLDCGHVWSSVNADQLKDLINDSGKPKTKDNLNL
ncbi:MAG: hypothetical protein JXI43_11755 [Tissierellales bacterium]|nr:hypothetical protein [Tissierellales bacterium]